jgi:hypothetical protein
MKPPVRSADAPVVDRRPMTPRAAAAMFLNQAIAFDLKDPATFPGALLYTDEAQA